MLLSKESLNGGGLQFHQYQQNEQSPLTSNLQTYKRLRRMTLEIQVLAWDRHTTVEWLNRLNEIKTMLEFLREEKI